ncbi:DUF6751 family protein [Caproicibacterium sp. BJN0003]|jgi:hypothetical protein|uniref:DUF6751 family protein n=1 Tax=Caproicibacterium sp. BJN0003 TaxID=2994078 RepID=UPI0022569A76|nr:DUF6751 family protein [Caproicibacterium sp. BJN0003]UZT82640.1 hypothetical protein OP489_02175 [Caproicibacterium sp. BJN0003]
MQMANETVTYYHLDDDGNAVSRTVISGASWYAHTVATVSNKSVSLGKVIQCRIPVENTRCFSPHEDDMLVLGDCDAPIGTNDADLRGTYNAVTISAVHDNRRGQGAHWKLEAV